MALLQIVENRKKSLGIYVHIPFCRSKCEYCDFYSLPGARNRDLMERYLDAVILHIREAAQGAAGRQMDGADFLGALCGQRRPHAATRSPGTCRRHLTGEGFVRFRNSCPRGPQKNGRYGGNEKNTCKNFRKGVCCQPESSPVRRSVWERMKTKTS